ncbi:precorrin-2 dehydrogenase/sirohydrochlorin ferrochelatase family protein [Qipengyuania sediminis]|uniref:precorrin-2 dehydrogenase/sirohydrochlorin ferrochelatase family protein n=1 Tax=Qipengyuania sediminis TaxID=1532023 RepID=UPI00105A03CD|nr:bifunctional precorrin-2 dehydrogenase/sirohydrochlorin ferrochelatase [Qipengyuania sediminis]
MAVIHSLPLFLRVAGKKIVVVGDGHTAAAKRRLVERAGGICCTEAEGGARLAFVALDEPWEAAAAAERLKARGLLVNIADRPELCDFTLPSVLERGDVLIAVGTGGTSAGLAKHLRLRLEALLPSALGPLAAGLGAAKQAMRARWPDPDARRRALDAALAEGGPLDPLDAGSSDRIGAWLANAQTDLRSKTVEIVLASDDPDELTLRQARLLGMADTLVHEAAVPAAILARARADAVRASPGDQARPGLTVVLLRG